MLLLLLLLLLLIRTTSSGLHRMHHFMYIRLEQGTRFIYPFYLIKRRGEVGFTLGVAQFPTVRLKCTRHGTATDAASHSAMDFQMTLDRQMTTSAKVTNGRSPYTPQGLICQNAGHIYRETIVLSIDSFRGGISGFPRSKNNHDFSVLGHF
jgi:hypothetical protein